MTVETSIVTLDVLDHRILQPVATVNSTTLVGHAASLSAQNNRSRQRNKAQMMRNKQESREQETEKKTVSDRNKDIEVFQLTFIENSPKAKNNRTTGLS